MLKSILLCLFLPFIFADEIRIYEPPLGGLFHPEDIMDIRYTVRSMGMTKIWSTDAKLTHIETNKTIDSFPKVPWVFDGNKKNDAHGVWTIPKDIPIGNYSLTINGNTTYMCSVNNDGKAPFGRCRSTMYKYITFTIYNGTLPYQ